MSRVFLKAQKDTSIYEVYPTLNAGRDEILEVGKNDGDELNLNLGSVRSLIQFDLTDLKGASTSSIAYLNLKVAHAEDLQQNERVYVYAISESWDEGSGYYIQRPFVSDDGSTWQHATSGSDWTSSGSSYYEPASISFDVSELDNNEIRVDVTPIIERIITGSVDDFGMLLKFSDSSENNVNNRGNIRFFSRQTHTVHEPVLELVWDGFSFSTGSLSPIPNTRVKISPTNLQREYFVGEKSLIYFNVRDPYPLKNYTNTIRFGNKYYLPSGSQYSITDAQAGTTIIPFDQYSAIDCDASGSNILLDTTPLYRNRFYNIQLKIPFGDEVIYTEKYRFEIE